MADYKSCVGYFSVVLIGILSFNVVGIFTKENVLLDTSKVISGDLNWTKKIVPADPPDQLNGGWNEVTTYLINLRLDPYKIHTSCHVDSKNVNNWLRTPFIDVGNANSLFIDMTFTMRRCVKHTDPEKIQSCRETFNLYSYQADRDIANNEMPTWDDASYSLVDIIPAHLLAESANDVRLNNVTKFVPLRKGVRGIYFAFQDTGACVSLVVVKVYFKLCPNITRSFAFFSETPTGELQTSSVPKDGVCVAHSMRVQSPLYYCMSDGTWDIPQGGCQCDPGYEGVNDQQCVGCSVNTFKWETGNSSCQPCPEHSYTDATRSKECQCYNSYYRADTDSKSMPCTQPPSAPRSITVVTVSDTMVQLSWLPPDKLGGRTDTVYRVDCPKCSLDVMYSPRADSFNSTSVELKRLQPSTTYVVKIYAENGVSSLSSPEQPKYLQHEFTTEATIAEIYDIKLTDYGDDFLTIEWKVKGNQDSLDSQVLQYEVRNGPRGEKPVSNFTTTATISFKDLFKDQEYEIRIKGETRKGWGEFSSPFFARTGTPYDSKNQTEEPGTPLEIIIGAIVAVIVCMAIAGLMVFILINRIRRQEGKNPDLDGPYHHVTVPLFQPSGTIKSYVDPHTYEDPNQAVREFTREIDASHISIDSVIGGGEFGDVCKGKLRVPSRPEMTVAIKTLKPGATDKNRLDFLTEASIMGQFDDPNVIFLEGVVTKTSPIMIVTEYMANGSLDSFLRKNDGQLSVIQLVGMMRGIASGMKYLSEMGYVHRDLAARNILCNESLVCKVADFGLSREVDVDTTEGAYTTKGGKIPVRWTAPEAITFRKFTSASDAWSFGVVMWEVISYGERPYWNWSNQDVIKAVEKGYRLPPPMECPEAIHQLMLDCWQKERGHRPKFVAIVKSLDKLIRAPELLRKMAKPKPHVFVDNTPPEVANNFASVEEWLVAIKMDRYRDNFMSAGVTSMDQVLRITVKDLETIGVSLLGHQKKIINSVQTLRAQLLGPQVQLPHMHMSEGFLV
ncbi:ephrin type-B receptor 1-B-like isoform X2 [Dreissena polymorpha]|uniref:ephrin type-B receptor 1-B-like isoform X2 n=1 Tax=Dreissena polymorpha TaxID=45954 RepID=UPI0022649880|nr:ephrin type-B receptor 1-B-like isoform X2 [Dreissena polymorpha]